MSLPFKIATALKLQRLINGESIPFSQLKDEPVESLINEGLIHKKLQGRTKSVLYVTDVPALNAYILNRFGIQNLSSYIEGLRSEDLTRSESVALGSNSKLKNIRTFKGFLVNCYQPIPATLNGQPVVVAPSAGTFVFISDFETFIPAPDVTIIGVENSENFRFIEKQQKYFSSLKPLFVSRYPQGNDMVKWLSAIANQYLHFGDFDFEGVNIYLNEYKKHLNNRASFFIPTHIEQLIQSFGNSELYDSQFQRRPHISEIAEENIHGLFNLFHSHKKVLEQEILISK